jgi:WD40 repeat protein
MGGAITSVALDSGGGKALSGSEDGSLILWDVDSGQAVQHLASHELRVNAVAISSDGNLILSTGDDRYIRLWDGETDEMLDQEARNCWFDKLVSSKDGRVALASCNNILYLWDIQNWREKQRFLGHTTDINALDISSDGSLGISASSGGSLRLWSLQGQFDYQTVGSGMVDVLAMDFDLDGKRLLLGSVPPTLRDVAIRKTVKTYPGFDGLISPGAVAVSPDGRYVSAAGGFFPPKEVRSLLIWELESGKIACKLEGHHAFPRGAAFSPDSRMLLAGSQDEGTSDLILWDVESCQIIRRFKTDHDTTRIAFNADGSQAITGQGGVPELALWDVATGRKIRSFVTDQYPEVAPILDVAFGPDDLTVLGSSLENLYMWDIQSGEILRRYTGHSGGPWSLDISPDGRYVVSASDTGEVILWNFATGEELYHLQTHKQGVFSVIFSKDGKSVFSISTDGMLTQWQLPEKSLEELIDWVKEHRYVRELTCEERAQYRVEPLCVTDGN